MQYEGRARDLDIILLAKGSLWRISRQETKWSDLSERPFWLLVGGSEPRERVKQMDLGCCYVGHGSETERSQDAPGSGLGYFR